ncbi:NAD(P)-dependent oxidoreductase [Streptomyces sp. E5N91]|uniref:NAD-dependent epimerase/dehydratase family protein n=1 Tax=Streptomyces sp. E5N91 TaxID=1851996 RepID=UPI00187D23C2|nr:NAD(P)-dependent oxidoreductase [Streptomyces sp. E5N91]
MTLNEDATGRRVLVTGGSGMLGSHVVERLLARGAAVTVLDRKINRRNLAGLPDTTDLRTVEGDVREPGVLDSAVAGQDAVVHLAAVLMARSADDPRAAFEINVAATQELLGQCVRHEVGKLVLGSSVGVYGVPESDDQLIDEGHPIGARTFYGAAKFANELFCRAYHDSFGLDYVALRFGTLYGDRMNPEGFYPGQLLRLIDERDSPQVRVAGSPDELHDFLYAGDAAEAAVRAALGPPTDVTLNVVSGRPTTWAGIVGALFECLDVSPAVDWQPREVAWAPRRRFDGSRATAVLGLPPATELPSGLRRLVDWHLGAAG